VPDLRLAFGDSLLRISMTAGF